MQVRGENYDLNSVNFVMEPNSSKLVIIDVVERDQPFKFEY